MTNPNHELIMECCGKPESECRCELTKCIEVGISECVLCGLIQPSIGMATDNRNGNDYCADRVACWERWDKRNL